jgi:Scaffold protein Nfu/NifU N terminal
MSHVRYQPTPNPNAGKFTVGRKFIEGRTSRSYFTREQAAADPVATALFALDGVASVFMVDDFVTVTKDDAADWSELGPRVSDVLERVLW